jgi:hypothetical protein
MAQTVKKVVEIIAPIALDALATAAEALIAGAATQQAIALLPERTRAVGDNDDGQIITKDTWSYCETNFATQYGYFYAGMRSQPVTGDLTIAAAEDIIVWEKTNGIADIQTYLQTIFKDSISDADAIELAQNLGTIFQQRFSEVALEWTPFSKRYNFRDQLIVDVYMVTSPATDVNQQPAGIASYCFVAYEHQH